MYPILIWSETTGYRELPESHMADDCDMSKQTASFLLGKEDNIEEICCQFIDAGRGAFLVWVCDEFDLLVEYANSDAGRHIREFVDSIPHPGLKPW